MAVIIPGCFLLIALFFLQSGSGWRESILRANLAIYGVTAIATELLSALGGISYQSLAVWWGAVLALLLALNAMAYRKDPARLRESLRFVRSKGARGTGWLDKLVLASIGLILLLTLVTALYSPPNNFDSMTYHMARIANWIQNRGVQFYPTSIARQNYSMPLAEYMVMHLQVLSQSDHFANLVQWWGFWVLIILAGKAGEVLGLSRRGQLFSGLFVAALPIAILESSSTQNDLLTGVFCLSFAYYLVKLIHSGSWRDGVWGGLAFGFGLLTKGTAYLYCAAIGVSLTAVGLAQLKGKVRIQLLQKLSVLVVLGLALNMPFYFRNLAWYGTPLGAETGRVTVDGISAAGTYASLVRNTFAELAVPFPGANAKLTSLLEEHLGSLADDPSTTFPGARFAVRYLINEDEGGNLLQALLLLSLIGLLPGWLKRKDHLALGWAGAVLLSGLLFSTLIKWQPWGTRLLLPVFCLAAPLFGSLIERFKRSWILPLAAAASLALYSLPYLFLNSTRPLIPLFQKSSPLRSNTVKRFFSDRPDLYQSYAEIIAPFYKDLSVLHTDRERLYFASQMAYYDDYTLLGRRLLQLEGGPIGLLTGSNDWEYPIWVLTDQHYGKGDITFVHLSGMNRVQDLSAPSAFLPPYIVVTQSGDPGELPPASYQSILDLPTLDLYQRISH